MTCGKLITLVASALIAQGVQASVLLYSQPADGYSQFGSSNLALTGSPMNTEAGDDFNVVGTIDRVTVRGERWNFSSTILPPIGGAYVRFYASTNGLPGAKQYEQFVPFGPNISIDGMMSNLSVSLPTPFAATGKHFITVQLKTDEPWYWWTSNSGNIFGAPGVYRDNLSGGVWTQASMLGKMEDGSFELYGTLTGSPVLSSLSTASADRSARFRISGTSFGNVKGTVTVGGVTAFVTRWTSNLITAYVPEQAPLGTDLVKVTTTAGSSNTLGLNVTARVANGRIKWRFAVDGAYTSAGAAVGPDGSVYISDTYGWLYALDANGGLKWLRGGGFYGSIVSTGPDGTIYIGNSGGVTAVNPNGTTKWIYDDGSGWMLAGPNVGPDGNIYFATAGLRGGKGISSLTPAGTLRWNYVPVNEYGPDKQNLSFGNGNVYVGFDQYGVDPHNAVIGLRQSDGALVFKTFGPGGENVDTAVGTNGDVYAATWYWDLIGLSGTGTIKWSAFGAGAAISPPRVGPDGTIYIARNLSYVHAVNQNGTIKWTYSDSAIHETPRPDPQNTILIGCGQLTYGENGFIEAFSKTGSLLWRTIVPAENPSADYPGVIVPYYGPTFTPDGATAYFGSTHPGQNALNEYSYLYAVQVKNVTTASDNASIPLLTVASTMTAGQTYSVSVSATNTGTTTWTSAAGYRLECLQGSLWNKPTVALSSADAIAPGQTKKFSFTVNAPTAPGTYLMQWQMSKAGARFGSGSTSPAIAVSVRQHAAKYISQSVPSTVKAGAAFTVTVTMQNVGTLTWTKAAGFMLASTKPDMNVTWGPSTIALSSIDSIAQGSTKTFTFSCVAPTTPGTYTMQWRMYRSASAFTGFFGDVTGSRTITVSP